MQTMTIISGVVLLAVFALVAWSLRRRGDGRVEDDALKKGPLEDD